MSCAATIEKSSILRSAANNEKNYRITRGQDVPLVIELPTGSVVNK